jgi:probable HAF family extracellular repeat protein
MKAEACASKLFFCTLLILLGLAMFASPANAVTQYTITDLGTLGGTSSRAKSINSLGQVVGGSRTVSGSNHAFLWENGVMYDLNSSLPAGSDWCLYGAEGINDAGQIVGNGSRDGQGSAFLWENGGVQDIDTATGDDSTAGAINAGGQVVGGARFAGGERYAFLWDSGVMQQLGALGGTHSYACGINASTQVVGKAYLEDSTYHAFLWEEEVMHDLGTLGGPYSWAYGINASGEVVGWASDPSDDSRAFLWLPAPAYGLPAGMHDLGTLGGLYSHANGINASGYIVGAARTASDQHHASLWHSGVMYDLNDLLPVGSGWELISASAINDRGQIVGSGSINGETHAFLLTPIPEPSMLGLVGLALLVAMRRLRRS